MEVIVISVSECIWFERKLATFLAPSLLGIKCAGIFSIDKTKINLEEHISRFNKKASPKGLKLKYLCDCNEKCALLLLYHEKLLKEQLSGQKQQQILKHYGYPENSSFDCILKKLSHRLKTLKSFPHEIGIFLGYPVEDVVGFILNKGENYKLCGYWKVYGNTEKAKYTFEKYDKCRNFLCNKMNQGYDLYQALKIS